MKDPEDPIRLTEEASAPLGLRVALERARADAGSDSEVARLAARLGPLLGPAPVAPAPVSLPAPSHAAVKAGLGALGVFLIGGAAWLLSGQTTSAPSLPTVRSAPTTLATASSALPAPPATVVAAPVVAEPPAASAAPPAVRSESKAPSSTSRGAAGPLSEAELLEQARAALKAGDGARALQRASEHAQRFPRGALVQEREVLAIRALRRLGRDPEADRRAEAFAKAHPGSAFQPRLPR